MRQGNAPVYYVRVLLLLRNILTRTTKVMSVNKLGKMCDVMWTVSKIVKNTIIPSFVSVIRQYSVKNFYKCIKTTLNVSRINMFNQKLQNWKNYIFLGMFSIYFVVKKFILIFRVRCLSLKNGQMCHQNSLSNVSWKILLFFFFL